MRKHYLKKSLLLLGLFTSFCLNSFAQLPDRVLVGYWHNWETLRITNVDSRYNVICLAFMEANGGDGNKDNNSVNNLVFTPAYLSSSQMKSDIQTVQGQGKKVLISIGGANGSFALLSTTDKNTFVTKVKSAITTYGVDGIDIDIERTVYLCNPWGKLASPIASMQYLIDGIKEILTWYQTTYGKKMILTTAPEITYTTAGLSPWNACNGAFLPFIEQLRDDLDLVMVQLYNAGSNYSIKYPSSTTEYWQESADFIITQTEAIIEGFKINNTNINDTYSGISASKVAVALPASNSSTAAPAGGYTQPSTVKAAVEYLMGCGSKPGNYTLSKSYPNLRGLMTWSINEDAATTSGVYSFAAMYESISCVVTSAQSNENKVQLTVQPNPTEGEISIQTSELGNAALFDISGKEVYSFVIDNYTATINISHLPAGVYFLKQGNSMKKIVKQ